MYMFSKSSLYPKLFLIPWLSSFCHVKACSHGIGGPRGDEVPDLPVVKKYLSSHATLGVRGEVQNAITPFVKYARNKELTFVFLVCSDEAAFRFNVVVAGRMSVWFCCLPWPSDSTLKLSPALSISLAFWQFWRWIVEITRHARSSWQPCCSWHSDLITLIRLVTPLRSFHMEKTHPTEAGYPDQLSG